MMSYNARHIDVILVDSDQRTFIVGKSSLQEIANFAIIREIPDINLETGRYGSKSGVSQIIRES